MDPAQNNNNENQTKALFEDFQQETRLTVADSTSRTSSPASNYINKTESQGPVSKIFKMKTANVWLEEAVNLPEPKPLYDVLWYEGQTAFLFGGPGAGKSLYAVQIAHYISQYQPVVYFDFELSQRQFAQRYMKDDRTFQPFPVNFYRIEFERGVVYTEEQLVKEIDATATSVSSKIIIIDNISWLLNDGEKATNAKNFMKELDRLKKDRGYSIMILGHTPKRDETRPIFLSDMAGSMALGNFIDTAFAIVRSFQESTLRYVKQLKERDTIKVYDFDSIKVLQIEKTNEGFLGLSDRGTAKESQHLKRPYENQYEDKKEECYKLLDKGVSYSKIVEQLGIAKGTITKWKDQRNTNGDVSDEDVPF